MSTPTNTPSLFIKQFIGQKELPSNKFTDETLMGKLLHAAGQKDGEAYCAYTQEAIFKECFPEKRSELNVLFDASAVKTFRNFEKAGYSISLIPQLDHLVVWQKYINGQPDWRGHCGCVVSIRGEHFDSFEGNTSSGVGDIREGDGFFIRSHNAAGSYSVKNGLRLLGFVKIG